MGARNHSRFLHRSDSLTLSLCVHTVCSVSPCFFRILIHRESPWFGGFDCIFPLHFRMSMLLIYESFHSFIHLPERLTPHICEVQCNECMLRFCGRICTISMS